MAIDIGNGNSQGPKEQGKRWLSPTLRWLRTALALVVLAGIWSPPAWSQPKREVWLTPIDPSVSAHSFRMLVRRNEVDGTGEVLMISVFRLEGMVPVSSISATLGCSQGLAVCNLLYDGQNAFRPTFIFLD